MRVTVVRRGTVPDVMSFAVIGKSPRQVRRVRNVLPGLGRSRIESLPEMPMPRKQADGDGIGVAAARRKTQSGQGYETQEAIILPDQMPTEGSSAWRLRGANKSGQEIIRHRARAQRSRPNKWGPAGRSSPPQSCDAKTDKMRASATWLGPCADVRYVPTICNRDCERNARNRAW